MNSRLSLVLLLLVSCFAHTAHASDSLWLLCRGSGYTHEAGAPAEGTRIPFVLTLFDERYHGDERLDTVKLNLGARTFVGRVLNLQMADDTPTPAQAIELKENAQTMFKGTITVGLTEENPSVPSAGPRVKLNGTAREDFDGTSTFVPMDAELSCERVK